MIHNQNPLAPADDKIVAPTFLTVLADNGAVNLGYDVKPGYTRMVLYRATTPAGPYILRQGELPLSGKYRDEATNGTTYYYRMLAINANDHRSAVLQAGPVTPRTDPTPPEGRVLIDDGALRTADLQVNLQFRPYEDDDAQGLGDITQVVISNDPSFAGAQPQPFGQNIPWQLAPTPARGTAQVYVRFRDAAGNESVDTSVDTIIFDPAAQTTHRIFLPLVQR